MEKKKGISSKVIIIISLLFFYLPIVYIIIFSFNSSRSLTSFGGFSLRWYQKMFADKNMIESLLYTIIVAILATIIS
ncbi:MAG: ABC transporter permease, partial [Firmicutes bacterium]|nr:ABC transporter permease [Bacillota bacterium]